jgi:indole-3-glycerol phosphate synthase
VNDLGARTPTVLDRIVAETRDEVDRRKRAAPRTPAGPPVPEPGSRSLAAALRGQGIGVIAEFKRRSPSAGTLREGARVGEMVAAYADGGAIAASILTEGPNFGGRLEDLAEARAACELPLLRKDFIVDPFQLQEARAGGADAVLLIVAALGVQELAELHTLARSLGLEVLVEVHDRAQARIALDAGAEIVGVNNRDLRDFSVDVGRTEQVLEALGEDVLVVSESGIAGPEQLARLRSLGVHGVLVGELLMRAEDPATTLRGLLGEASRAAS